MKFNELIDKWLPIVGALVLGLLAGKIIGAHTIYMSAPPRAIEGERMVQYKDSAYQITTHIDTTFYQDPMEFWDIQ